MPPVPPRIAASSRIALTPRIDPPQGHETATRAPSRPVSSRPTRQRRHARLVEAWLVGALPTVVPALLTVGLWLALPRPGAWLDEAATVSATSRSWGEMLRLVQHQDATLSGYYALTWATSHVTRLDPLAAARLISGLAYVAASALVASLGRRLISPLAGLIAGCAFALLPSTSSAAVNARPEAVATLLVAAVFWCAVRGWRTAQFAIGLLACWVYALDVLYLALTPTVTAVHEGHVTRSGPGAQPDEPDDAEAGVDGWATRRGLVVPGWRTALAGSLVGGVWLLICSRQQAQVRWIHTSGPGDLFASFTRVGFTAPLSRLHEQPALACSIALGVATAAAAAALSLRSAPSGRSALPTRVGAALRPAPFTSTHTRTARLLWATSVVPPLIATLAVAVGEDVFVERYFTPSSIGLALVVGLGGQWLLGRSRAAFWVVTALAVALSMPVLWASHRPDGHWGENLGVHTSAIDDASTVWFVAPRNRATLFADGELAPRWRDADWWASARASGTLWGPAQASPAVTPPPRDMVVVTDTRRRASLRLPAGCHVVSSVVEARATSLAVRCTTSASR